MPAGNPMAIFRPSMYYPIRNQLEVLVNQALVEYKIYIFLFFKRMRKTLFNLYTALNSRFMMIILYAIPDDYLHRN